MLHSRLREDRKKIRRRYDSADRRALRMAGASGTVSILLGLGKIASGLLAPSVFACINGCYTLGMALARYCTLLGAAHADSEQEQYRYCKISANIMIASSVLYVCYSLWAIWNPKTVFYGEILAITIATITFAEIGLNVRGILKYRRVQSPLLHALKTINLGASLISLVLTQSAILAFADEIQNPSVNGLLGVIMGTLAALLGVHVLIRAEKASRKPPVRTDIFDPDA